MLYIENCCSQIQTTVVDIYNTCSTAIGSLAYRIYAIARNCLETPFCCSHSSTSTFFDVQTEEWEVLEKAQATCEEISKRRTRLIESLSSPHSDLQHASNELREIAILQKNLDAEITRSSKRISEAVAQLIPIAVTSRGEQVVFESGRTYQPEIIKRMHQIAIPLLPPDIEVLWTNQIERVGLLSREDPLPELHPAMAAYLVRRTHELEREVGIRD